MSAPQEYHDLIVEIESLRFLLAKLRRLPEEIISNGERSNWSANLSLSELREKRDGLVDIVINSCAEPTEKSTDEFTSSLLTLASRLDTDNQKWLLGAMENELIRAYDDGMAECDNIAHAVGKITAVRERQQEIAGVVVKLNLPK